MSKKDDDVVEDFLSVDNSIPGQNFVCLSFVSPETLLKKKETFILHKFLLSMAKDYNLSETDLIDKF